MLHQVADGSVNSSVHRPAKTPRSGGGGGGGSSPGMTNRQLIEAAAAQAPAGGGSVNVDGPVNAIPLTDTSNSNAIPYQRHDRLPTATTGATSGRDHSHHNNNTHNNRTNLHYLHQSQSHPDEHYQATGGGPLSQNSRADNRDRRRDAFHQRRDDTFHNDRDHATMTNGGLAFSPYYEDAQEAIV